MGEGKLGEREGERTFDLLNMVVVGRCWWWQSVTVLPRPTWSLDKGRMRGGGQARSGAVHAQNGDSGEVRQKDRGLQS